LKPSWDIQRRLFKKLIHIHFCFIMVDIPQRILCSLIHEHGTSIMRDPVKFRNLLADYYQGGYKKERKCLSDALSERIPEILLTKKDQLEYLILSQQLSRKLIDDLGITPELAKWTVDSWAFALEVVTEVDLLPKDYLISINSIPQGAKVSLNGTLKGFTPLKLKNLDCNTYEVKISCDGYEFWTQSLEITSKNDQDLTAILEKKPVKSGTLAIETFPPNAEIYLNSKKYGRTDKTILNLSEGHYRVRLVLPGYSEILKDLQFQEGDNFKIQETFLPKPEITPSDISGKITVKSTPPFAAVYLDDQFIGNTPLFSHKISSGNHTLSLRLSSYGEFKDEILLSPGEEKFFDETLTRQRSSLVKKAVYAFCAMGILFLIFSIFPFTNPNAAVEWNAKGDAFYSEGKYPEALDAYNKAISYDQSSLPAWSNKGFVLNNLARFEEALVAFDKALSLDPGSTNPNIKNVFNGKGNALNSLSRYQEALDAQNKALSIDSTMIYAWYGKGVALAGLGRNQEAIDAYNRALELNPNYPQAQLNLQKLQAKMNVQPQPSAGTRSQKLAQIGEYISKGSELADDEKYEDAIGYYDQGLAILNQLTRSNTDTLPLESRLLSLKAFALQKLGRTDESNKVAQQVPHT
jgi:tetratricopeptide (TPR) repeat protein